MWRRSWTTRSHGQKQTTQTGMCTGWTQPLTLNSFLKCNRTSESIISQECIPLQGKTCWQEICRLCKRSVPMTTISFHPHGFSRRMLRILSYSLITRRPKHLLLSLRQAVRARAYSSHGASTGCRTPMNTSLPNATYTSPTSYLG